MSNINFTVSTGKEFRTKMAKYHVACHQLNDFILKQGLRLRNNAQILDNDYNDLEALHGNNSDVVVLRSEEEIKAEMVMLVSANKQIEKEIAKVKDKAKKSREQAEEMVTEQLYNAYVKYITNGSRTEYLEALAIWFKNNGFDDANAEKVEKYSAVVGMKKNGARASYKSGKLTDICKFNAYRTLFLSFLADTLQEQQVISPFKYTYVPDKKKDNK